MLSQAAGNVLRAAGLGQAGGYSLGGRRRSRRGGHQAQGMHTTARSAEGGGRGAPWQVQPLLRQGLDRGHGRIDIVDQIILHPQSGCQAECHGGGGQG